MSRRFGTENIFHAYALGVVPGASLLPPTPGFIYSPRKIVLSTPGASATVDFVHASGAAPFLQGVTVPATDTVCVNLPEGLNCPKGSGIDIVVSGGSVNVNLYYVPYDESPGITKVAARTATYDKQNQLDNQGRKAIRARNELNLGDKD